jgi:hypothetical protein
MQVNGKKNQVLLPSPEKQVTKELRLISNSEVKDLRVSSFERAKRYLRTHLPMYTLLKKKSEKN